MFYIWIEDICVYDDQSMSCEEMRTINPHLTIEDNSGGSLEFIIPPTYKYYDLFTDARNRNVVTVYLYDKYGNKPYWIGRIYQITADFYNNRHYYCEGPLAWLNDAYGQDYTVRKYGSLPSGGDQGVELAKVWLGYALRGYNELAWGISTLPHDGPTSVDYMVGSQETYKNMTYLLRVPRTRYITWYDNKYHINKTEQRFQLYRGDVTVSIPNPVDSNGKARPYQDNADSTCYDKVMNLVNNYGGHIVPSYDNKFNVYLDWYKDYWKNKTKEEYLATAKEVRFGKNLLDYVSTNSVENFFTVIRPKGDDSTPKKKNDDSAYNTYIWQNAAGKKITWKKRLTASGNVTDEKDSNWGVTEQDIAIDSYETYYYSGRFKADNGSHKVAYAVLGENDAGNKVILYTKNVEGKQTTKDNKKVWEVQSITREQIPIPEGAKYIRCCWYADPEYKEDKKVVDWKKYSKVETQNVDANNKTYTDISLLDHDDSEDLNPYLYLVDSKGNKLVDQFGWIEKPMTFNNINHAEGLYLAAKNYLKNVTFSDVSYEIKFIDMGLTTSMFGTFKVPELYDPIRVISDYHGIDEYMFITKIDIPMNQPEQMLITLGKSLTYTLTDQVVSSK